MNEMFENVNMFLLRFREENHVLFIALCCLYAYTHRAQYTYKMTTQVLLCKLFKWQHTYTAYPMYISHIIIWYGIYIERTRVCVCVCICASRGKAYHICIYRGKHTTNRGSPDILAKYLKHECKRSKEFTISSIWWKWYETMRMRK